MPSSSKKSSKSSDGPARSSSGSRVVPRSSSGSVKSANGKTSQSKSRPSNSVVTVKSNSSQVSVDSIGIGVAAATAIRPPPPDAHLRFRLMPEGSGTNILNVNDQVYDCLAFVILCEKHRTVALTNTSPASMFSFFPFVPLKDAFTWNRLSRDGLAIILGKSDETGDTGTDPTMADLPDYTTSWLNITRVQLPGSCKFYSRITQLVTLTENGEGKCCQANPRIRWLKQADVSKRGKVENLWGDEVVPMARGMRNEERVYLCELDPKTCMPTAEAEVKLLVQVNWSEKRVHELMVDYVKHMYPAFNMTANSLKCFLQKNSLTGSSQKRYDRLYKAFAAGGQTVSFNRFLIGLACMEPNAGNDLECRGKFIFYFYDTDNKGVLSSVQASELMMDLDPRLIESKVKQRVQHLMKYFGTNGTLSSSEFIDALRCENDFPYADQLLRLEKSYFEAKRAEKSKSNSSKKSQDSGLTRKVVKSQSLSGQEGACQGHSEKNYEYGLHAVTLDSTGRCVDPRIISDHWVTQWAELEMTRNRFSVENVFRNQSVANIFLDLVRDFKEHMDLPSARGLLTNEEDWEMLLLYLQMLTRQVLAILSQEPKLLRLTSPMVVFGDLQGGLRDLFHYESYFFRGTPVSGHSMLFLGNYSGPTFPYGFECIVYLFALKISMPNKIYLLRGRNELRSFNKSHLKAELLDKYGEDYGEKFLELLNGVFDYLPVAAILDESILCTHAGIPQLPSDRKLLRAIESDASAKGPLSDPKASFQYGYEMMVNVPVRYAHGKEEETETNQNGFGNSKTGYYRYFSRRAFEAFLKTNSFDYLIRSHNPCDDGYALCFDNRCLTIYSSCRCNNVAMTFTGVVLVNESKRKIRVMRFDAALMDSKKNKF